MIRTEILIGIVILLVSVTGCQEAQRQDTIKYDMTPGTSEFVLQGDGAFPDFLAGKWKGNKRQWGMAFIADGNISKVRIPFGKVMLEAGKEKNLPTKTGGEAVYIPGDWTVVYTPETRELAVRIEVNYISIEMGPDTLIGKQEYMIEGTVNEEGNIWKTTVSDYPEYERFHNTPEDVPLMSEVIFAKTKTLDI